MTQPAPASKSDKQLEAYYEADTRYSVVPIPTPVDRDTAEKWAKPKIVRSNAPDKLEKLSRLTILHNLTGTAKNWEAMIAQVSEKAPADVEKSAYAIASLAWIGTPEQWKKADDYFKGLLTRANPEESAPPLAMACAALGPAEGTAALKQWAQREADRLDKEIAKPAATRTPEALDNLKVRVDQIRQFANLDVADMEKEFAVRKAIDALPKPAEKAPKLVAIYCETGAESGAALVWWSANTMVRLAGDPTAKAAIVDALLKVAVAHAKIDKNKQPELDATRARALRAAVYFEAVLAHDAADWLAAQKDVGTDILALRPDWVYAAPHGH